MADPSAIEDRTHKVTVQKLWCDPPPHPLCDEPWASLKAGALRFGRTSNRTERYKVVVEMIKSTTDNMALVLAWLQMSLNKYQDLSTANGHDLASLIEDDDICFCVEYFVNIYEKKHKEAILVHGSRLRDAGYGHSSKGKSASQKRQVTISATGSRKPNVQTANHQQVDKPKAKTTSQPRLPKSQGTRDRLTPHISKQGPSESDVSKAMREVDDSPSAKRRKKDRNPPQIVSAPVLARKQTILNAGHQTTPGHLTRSHTHLKAEFASGSLGKKAATSASLPTPKNVKKRKAPDDADASRKMRRLGISEAAVKTESDTITISPNPDAAQLHPIDISASANLPRSSTGGSPGGQSISQKTRKTRRTHTRRKKAVSVASVGTRHDTKDVLPSKNHSVTQTSTCGDGNTVEKAKSSNADKGPKIVIALNTELVSADRSESCLQLALRPAKVSSQDGSCTVVEIDMSGKESLDHTGGSATDVLSGEIESTSPQPAIPTTSLEKEAGSYDSEIRSTDNLQVVSEGNIPAVLNSPPPSSATAASVPSLDTPDSSTTINTPTLPTEKPLPSFKPPLESLLRFDAVKTEDVPIDELGGVHAASSCSHLLHDVGMTDLPTSEVSENVIEEDIPRFPRPPLGKYPPIWSESRQELCESFDWFRSYQGGVYFTGGAVKGYLLSAFGAKRDIFKHDGKLIVSHGGGRAESIHSTKGKLATVAAGDQQADDKSVRALRQNYIQQRPLALVIDEKYALFPNELAAHRITYAVLGFYTIAHMWAEYQNANNESGRVIRYKFAFRWCDNQGAPWWTTPNEAERPVDYAQETEQETPQNVDPTESTLVTACCFECQKESHQVYSLCWVCLNPDCRKFWRRSDGSLLPEQLAYHPGFLTLPPSVPLSSDFVLKPAYPISEDEKVAKSVTLYAPTSYVFTRGFHCMVCGRLSCRSKWEKWECAHCHYSLTITGNIRRAKEFWGKNIISTGFRDSHVNRISGIKRLPAKKFDIGKGLLGNVQTFILPHNRGKIHHIQPGSPMGSEEADKIFEEYQKQALSGELLFRRWPLRAHKCRGTLLTNYFSQNTGQPYQYVGGDENTVPFETAPSAVLAARDLLQNRVISALGRADATFNEILSAAYMEKQKMAFHSDNETGLGPLVAGLSMGAAAMMHFRLNAKHDPERRQRGVMMSFTLRHGDILVMDGSGVQEFYEHTVVPTNFRIAATARQITPAHR